MVFVSGSKFKNTYTCWVFIKQDDTRKILTRLDKGATRSLTLKGIINKFSNILGYTCINNSGFGC